MRSCSWAPDMDPTGRLVKIERDGWAVTGWRLVTHFLPATLCEWSTWTGTPSGLVMWEGVLIGLAAVTGCCDDAVERVDGEGERGRLTVLGESVEWSSMVARISSASRELSEGLISILGGTFMLGVLESFSVPDMVEFVVGVGSGGFPAGWSNAYCLTTMGEVLGDMLGLFGEMELTGLGFAGLGITDGSGVTRRSTMSRVRASMLGDGVEVGVGVVLRGRQRTPLALSAVIMEGLMVFWRTAVVKGDPDKKT